MADGTPAPAELLYEVKDRVGWITLNRPQARNALTFAMYEGFAEICRAVPTDGSLRALVVMGAGGKAFAAGTDISQFLDLETAEQAHAYEARIERVLDGIERCPVPTIAALTGACTGGGAAIAAVCDLRLATADLRFGFPIARTLGNCLSAKNIARLVGLVGPARVSEMIITARLIDAGESKAAGLVSEVLPDAAALVARVSALTAEIAGHAPLTMRTTKEMIRRIQDAAGTIDDGGLIAQCYTSEDFREGVRAFLAKRKPDFKGL